VSILYENDHSYRRKYGVIAGVDEAGRGPLAGPLVVSACILPETSFSPLLNDSKKICPKDRESLYDLITNHAEDYFIEIIEAEEIDSLNIFQATMKGMLTCLTKLKIMPQLGLIDGNKLPPGLPFSAEAVVKGDGKFACIAAASILAKVTRDRIMVALDKDYPQYAFYKNKGYPTKEHLEAIIKYGACKYHRRSFKPVRKVLGDCTENEITYA